MITMSDNVAATSLFYFGGGCAKLTEFNTLIPTSETKVGCETPTYYGWGNTTTTAADQMAIVKTLAYDNNVLTPSARAYGLHLMESVTPTQRWGVTCGPWGTVCNGPDYADPVPGVTVALKNGWKYDPACVKQDESCPWQVNGMGWVEGKDRNYALAVLTTDDPAGKGHRRVRLRDRHRPGRVPADMGQPGPRAPPGQASEVQAPLRSGPLRTVAWARSPGAQVPSRWKENTGGEEGAVPGGFFWQMSCTRTPRQSGPISVVASCGLSVVLLVEVLWLYLVSFQEGRPR